MTMENSRNFVAKAQGAFGDMERSREEMTLAADMKRSAADRAALIEDDKATAALRGSSGQVFDTVVDEGGWAYKSLGDGTIEIVSVPPTSKLKPGTVLDPQKIAAISDASQRARAQRAFDSIQRVMAGQDPLKAPGGTKKTAGGAKKTAPSAGGAVDVTSMRGGTATPEDASVGGAGPVEGSMSSGVGSARSTILQEMPMKQPSRSNGGR